MADPSIVREWLAKADEDYNFAQINLDEGHNFTLKSVSTFSMRPRNTSRLTWLPMTSNSRKYTISLPY